MNFPIAYSIYLGTNNAENWLRGIADRNDFMRIILLANPSHLAPQASILTLILIEQSANLEGRVF